MSFSIESVRGTWQHEGFQRYFRSTGWMFLSKVLSMVVSFFATVFVARHLGPTSYGQLIYAVSFVGIFGFIASLGIDSILYRELIKYPDRRDEFLGTAFTLKVAAGAITGIGTAAFAAFFAQDDVSRILIFILSATFVFSSFQIVNLEFQARVKSKFPSLIILLINIILNSLKVLIVISGKGVIYLSLVLLLEPILYVFFYWFAYERNIGGKVSEWTFSMPTAKMLLADSWPLIFSSAFALIYSRIDQVLIKHLIDAHAVGVYGAAVTVAESWYFIPGIIVSSLFPAILNAKKTSEDLYRQRLGRLAALLLLLAVGISIVTMIFAPLIMNILYGAAFAGGIVILRIYVWGGIGIFLGTLAGNYLIAENYRDILIWTSFVSMAGNVVLNLVWIPQYGIAGAAWATLVSYGLGPLVIFCFKRTRGTAIAAIRSVIRNA
ncbi:MAG: flippase [Patescibacteria group bacterium]|nr:flippase [Patescibacteria group bacterium]MDE1946110.1 flippase [Patescibacteria group bacterium]